MPLTPPVSPVPHPCAAAVSSLARRSLLHAVTGLAAAAVLPAGAAQTAWPAVIEPAGPGALDGVVVPGAAMRTVYTEGRWCEGPVWSPTDGGLVFSDVRSNRLMALRGGADAQATVLRDPSNFSNGNALDRQGRLLSCEHGGRRVVRREADGRLTVLADRHDGRRLNSPNDLVVAPDGAVWFTDPVFGITQPDEGFQAEPEQRGRYLFRLAPDGRLAVAADGFDQPNGIAFAPDFRTLYVSEAGAARDPDGGGREIRAFDVGSEGRLSRERRFARLDTGIPDGLKTDAAGRVYAATGDGVRIWAADSTLLGLVRTAAACGNLAFGGSDGRTLYVCSGPHIHALALRSWAAWA
ncbi:SMP-30/gluconolactonase/LRE family protein [uncultured Xylophilus sp.]|uniref:SMP-30/gluconolactonase/LRE family protein n=1 Tax=uncultured Xylophilus sp. TaxID=296832 RepID=UPI0025D87936|nr:SMP-30/gluconolactonase/LRE family protein [uncultured Xylophilus sp.]